jgi:hypothetical protein
MNTLQQLAALALVIMTCYIVYVHLTKNNAIPLPSFVNPPMSGTPAGPIAGTTTGTTTETTTETNVIHGVPKGTAPPGGFSSAPASAMFNPEANGILPANHDKFEQKAEFQSDLTNMNQFYKNNPELFHKTGMDISWSEKSDAMHQSHVTAQSAWVGPSNQDVTVGSPI